MTMLSGMPSRRIPRNTAIGAVPLEFPLARHSTADGVVMVDVSIPCRLTVLVWLFRMPVRLDDLSPTVSGRLGSSDGCCTDQHRCW